MSLVRQVPGDPAYIVATLGYGADHAPQNIAEQAFEEPPARPRSRATSTRALAGPIRLAFLVPAATSSIPYQLSTILGLFRASGSTSAPAALPPGATPASPPALADPGALETRIEAPVALVLSPHDGATWSHATTPVTRNGRTELWHTRLSEGDPAGRALRAIWTEGLDPSSPPADDAARPDVADPGPPAADRAAQLGLRHRRLHAAAGPGEPPDAVRARARGWTRTASGPTRRCRPGSSLVEWRHIATMARDQFVKTVEVGFLFPFGHRAALTKITERKVNPVPSGGLAGKPAAYLRQRRFIVVRQPVVSYPADDDNEPNDGRQRPSAGSSSGRSSPRTSRPSCRSRRTPTSRSRAATEIPFNIVGRTGRGGRASSRCRWRSSTGGGRGRDEGRRPSSPRTTRWPADDLDLRQGPLHGAKVGFAPSTTVGDTVRGGQRRSPSAPSRPDPTRPPGATSRSTRPGPGPPCGWTPSSRSAARASAGRRDRAAPGLPRPGLRVRQPRRGVREDRGRRSGCASPTAAVTGRAA